MSKSNNRAGEAAGDKQFGTLDALSDRDLARVTGGVDEFAIPHAAVRIPTSNYINMNTSSTIKAFSYLGVDIGKSANG